MNRITSLQLDLQ